MRLIFVYGMPATGKLTVGRELAAMTGYTLFHNHLVVDLLLSVFEFGSAGFVDLRERIWLEVFERACADGIAGMIFTFAPESTVRSGFAGRVVETVERGGGMVDFVELVCSMDELKARMGSESRKEFGKLASVELFEELCAGGVFVSEGMPAAKVRVDTGSCSPEEAARLIVRELGLRVI
jgi:hypothetical protein